jgi:hypothetical protein
MNYQALRKEIFRWIVLACAAWMALRLYFVQELIAAFFIFSILFACVAAVVLVVFMMDHAAQIAFAWAEAFMRAFGRPARPHEAAVNGRATAGMLTPIHEHRTATGK